MEESDSIPFSSTFILTIDLHEFRQGRTHENLVWHVNHTADLQSCGPEVLGGIAMSGFSHLSQDSLRCTFFEALNLIVTVTWMSTKLLDQQISNHDYQPGGS